MAQQGMEAMTAAEAKEALRAILARWDYCIGVALEQGLTQSQAEEVVGRYFKDLVVVGG